MALGNVRRLEAVQRTFTARLAGMEALNYWERLERLLLHSLEWRRERFLAIYIWKVLNELMPEIEGAKGAELRLSLSERRGQRCVLPQVNKPKSAHCL